ncbi:MAG: DUF983 domain-containing protein [Mangrovicoccus sp.]|nr:DUF983 domain-containing protein [Mangrovicoccus sp.]
MSIIDTAPDDRPMGPAIRRGLMCRCPNCGKGRVLQGYLKLRPACPVCHEDLSHQRTDDGPAYLTILVVGHLMAPILLSVYTLYRPEPWVTITVFSIGCVGLSLALLPRFKGMMLAIQWARRMHGFDQG